MILYVLELALDVYNVFVNIFITINYNKADKSYWYNLILSWIIWSSIVIIYLSMILGICLWLNLIQRKVVRLGGAACVPRGPSAHMEKFLLKPA